MKKFLTISGSSYLIPNNKYWSILNENFVLNFSSYGDWSGSLIRSGPDDAHALVIFIDDLLGNNDYDENSTREKLSTLINLIKSSLNFIKAPIVVSVSSGNNFELIRVAKKNNSYRKAADWLLNELELLASINVNLYLINLDDQFSIHGTKHIFDNRNWYLSHCRISSIGHQVICDSIARILNRHFNAPSKVLVLDCDNTIWGGVVGEDGVNGLHLGQDGAGMVFVEFQREVKRLVDEGVILALASKNNEEDVWRVFDLHPSMILKREDIVAWKINWSEKSHNIKSLSMELDLGLESFVFWDDNPVERDKLKMHLPDVKTIDVPQDIVDWPSRLRGLDFFAKFYLNKDDLNKTQQYHNRAKFIRDKTDVVDEKTYLKSIKLMPTIYGLDESNINRATQLCNKTNQFNLRTIRHTAQDLMDMNNQKKGLCFVVGLTDVYGEHGIVGLVCLKIIRPHTIFIDTFLMSCRVIGRHLESWMLNEIVNYCKNNGFTRLIGEYISSKNNILVEQFYEEHNFKLLEENELLEGVSTASASGFISRLYEYKMDDNKIPFMEIYEKDQHF